MANVIDQQQTSTDSVVNLRYASTNQSIGQKIIPTVTAKCSQITFKLKQIGSIGAGVYAYIFDDSSGTPGTLLATSDVIDTGDISTITATDYTFSFTGADLIYLNRGITYHIVIGGSYAISQTKYVEVSINSAGGYANGYEEESSPWTINSGVDMYFKQLYDDTTIISAGGALFFAQY